MLTIKKDDNGIVIVKAQKPILEDGDIEVSSPLFTLVAPPCTYSGDEESGYILIPVEYENEPKAPPEAEQHPPSDREILAALVAKLAEKGIIP